MFNIETRHLNILKNILKNYDYTFYVFGSRITGRAKALSDIDLFYKESIPLSLILKLEEELEESDLPYKVDLVHYDECDRDFKKILDSNNVCIQLASNAQSS